jgi:[NiFe] hydrogenase diaphorase moiety small subunit
MSETITFTIDGKEVTAQKSQTILEAADDNGVYIPRLCWAKKLIPGGVCRVCTVLVNGRPQAACTQPAAAGIEVQNDVEPLRTYRKNLIEMLFVEGNHFCMFCEKSGNCELQALGYRFAMTAPKYPYMFPQRDIDMTHPDVMIDRNRCIMCGRCVRSSRDLDGKSVFQFIGRGGKKKLGVDAEANLAGTALKVTDEAVSFCPVGSIMRKRVGYAIPIGKRLYDHEPIGSDVEGKAKTAHPEK